MEIIKKFALGGRWQIFNAFGGGERNRTAVQENKTNQYYERSLCINLTFKRPQTGSKKAIH